MRIEKKFNKKKKMEKKVMILKATQMKTSKSDCILSLKKK